MRRIYKYQLSDKYVEDVTVIPMPSGARILSVGEQDGKLMLWAAVIPDNPKTNRTFRVFGTGMDIDNATLNFIGTVQMPNGLVWHVFEEV